MIPEIGCVVVKNLLEKFNSAEQIFKLKKRDLLPIEGLGEYRIKKILSAHQFLKNAELEINFLIKNKIHCWGLLDKEYPQKLLNCPDAPIVLYYRGKPPLNYSKTICIVGTRTPTNYGKELVENFLMEIKDLENICIVSGLAYGIDGIAHKKAVQLGIPTIGVVAHGINSIYPPQHANLAQSMLTNGGILTEFRKDTPPDKHNFPKRNRIVAGMSDLTIIVETALKGGSMITADLASSYHKDVFAFPGRVNDPKSAGCLQLILNNTASLLVNGKQLIETMGWDNKKVVKKIQKELFIELTPTETIIINILKERKNIHIDELLLVSKLTYSQLANALLNLEINDLINNLPGKFIEMN